MVQQPKQQVEFVEQRAQISSREAADQSTFDQPQALDLDVLRQIGGGTTESPNKGW